jgi:TonB-dependent receptor
VLYELRDGEWTFFDITQSGSRFFFDLTEDVLGTRADWTVPLAVPAGVDAEFKVGTLLQYKDRSFDARRFRFFQQAGVSGQVDLTGSPEEIFAPENIAPDLFELRESTRPNDNYAASHLIQAGYVMADLEVMDGLRLVAGVRVEYSDQQLESFDPFAPGAAPITSQIEKTDVLPSVNFTRRLGESSNLRLAYTRTVARPDFREVAPFEFTDFVGGRAEIGNPDLNRTLIDNADLRWESFPGGNELVAASLFYKVFHDPIEQVIQPTAQLRVSYQNAESARSYGAELEYRRGLGFLSPRLAPFSINTNLTAMSTEVTLREGSGVQTSSDRSLQGQSPLVLNAALRWERPARGTSADLLYHVFGRRIEEVGAQTLPDVYEEARHHLDLVVRHDLGSGLGLKAGAKNLLDDEVEFTQGGEVYRRYRLGRSFSLGISKEL